MINKKNRKLILVISLVIIISGIGYAWLNLKRNPYTAGNFVSIELIWGKTNGQHNYYNSKTGKYQFLDSRDSLFEVNLKLRKSEIIFLHNKLFELGYWNLPDKLGRPDTSKSQEFTSIDLRYKGHHKRLEIYNDYQAVAGELDSALAVNSLIQKVLQESLERYVPDKK